MSAVDFFSPLLFLSVRDFPAGWWLVFRSLGQHFKEFSLKTKREAGIFIEVLSQIFVKKSVCGWWPAFCGFGKCKDSTIFFLVSLNYIQPLCILTMANFLSWRTNSTLHLQEAVCYLKGLLLISVILRLSLLFFSAVCWSLYWLLKTLYWVLLSLHDYCVYSCSVLAA